MRVMVTGGAGFIGSNLVDELIIAGHDVCIIDNLLTGSYLKINSKAAFYELDINSIKLNDIFKKFQPQVVFHLAAQVNVTKSIKEPLLDENINIRGTLNLLDNCKKFNVGKIIYSSSAAVYGIPNSSIIDESHGTNPISFYGISKLTPEYYIRTYSYLYGIQYSILRYSNVFGPRQDYLGEGGVVAIFLNKLLNGEKLIVYGDGEQTRDFTYVKDVVRANIASMKPKCNGIFNISTSRAISINQLIDIMLSFSKDNIEVKYDKQRVGDIRESCLDNSLALSTLGWEPIYTIEKGIEETFKYYSYIKNVV